MAKPVHYFALTFLQYKKLSTILRFGYNKIKILKHNTALGYGDNKFALA
jgi:hypothetical protein